MLTKQELLKALTPLYQNESVARIALGVSIEEYRAIEAAVLSKLAQGVSVERLKNIDWQQFAMHGGEPCFDLDRDGSLCGRARHWFGHNAPGSFVSLHDFATTAIAAARVQENERCVQALEAIWHSNDDSTKKCINAIRALINTNLTTGEMK